MCTVGALTHWGIQFCTVQRSRVIFAAIFGCLFWSVHRFRWTRKITWNDKSINPAQNVGQICLPHEKIPNFQTVQMNFAQLALKRWFRCYGKLKPNSARVAKWACLLCIGMWFWMAGWSLQWARWDIYLDLPISSTSAVIMSALTWSQWQSVTKESRSNFETTLKTYQSKTLVYNMWHNVTHARETFWGLKIFLSSETRLKCCMDRCCSHAWTSSSRTFRRSAFGECMALRER